ncbi:MAG: zinc-dependent peptidase [Gemmatimonadaceae bacterium]
MDALLVPVAMGAAFLGAIAGVVFVLRRAAGDAVRRAANEPLPEAWLRLLDRDVPASSGLTTAERVRLLQRSRDLIGRVHWEGCRGVVVDETMQFMISAQACLMTFRMPGEHYENLREILIYPSTFVPRPACRQLVRLTRDDDAPVPELGETWSSGTVVLSWDSVTEGAADPRDGRNVVYHEFAHVLATEHDLDPTRGGGGSYEWGIYLGTGAPPRPDMPNPDEWLRVLDDSFHHLADRLAAGQPTVLGDYAATKKAELIAVGAEAFFEKPRELRDEDPAFYAQLSAFYRQDPAAALS